MNIPKGIPNKIKICLSAALLTTNAVAQNISDVLNENETSPEIIHLSDFSKEDTLLLKKEILQNYSFKEYPLKGLWEDFPDHKNNYSFLENTFGEKYDYLIQEKDEQEFIPVSNDDNTIIYGFFNTLNESYNVYKAIEKNLKIEWKIAGKKASISIVGTGDYGKWKLRRKQNKLVFLREF